MSELARWCRDRDVVLVLACMLGAGVLRFYELDVVPNGLFCDEASNGYDAWSIFHTGADQYGELGLFSRGFGDWNESLYRYLSAPVVGVFGLSAASARAVSALAGTLTIGLAALLAIDLTGDRRCGVWTAALLAISPWHLLFSRIAFRGILLPFFLTLGVLLLFRALRRGRGYLPATIVMLLACWTYSPGRVLVPTVGLAVIVLYAPELWRHRRRLWPSVLLGAAGFAVLAVHWSSAEGMARAGLLMGDGTLDVAQLLARYGSHFRPSFLFEQGDPNTRHSFEGWGQLHVFEIVTVGAGLVRLLARGDRRAGVLLVWLLVAPLPAALTASTQALRAIGMVVPLAVFSGVGLMSIVGLARPRRLRVVVALAAALALAQGGYRLSDHLFNRYPYYATGVWQYGFRDAIALARGTDRDCFVISERAFLPHVFILFYGDVDPAAYQRHPIRSADDVNWTYGERRAVGRWEILDVAASLETHAQCAFVAHQDELPAIRETVGTVRFPNGDFAFEVFTLPEARPLRSPPAAMPAPALP